MKLSLVISARNQARNIDDTLGGLRRRLADAGIDYEILVVDDASTDVTQDEVRVHRREDPRVRLLVTGLLPAPHPRVCCHPGVPIRPVDRRDELANRAGDLSGRRYA